MLEIDIIQQVCNHFGVTAEVVVKKRRGRMPEYTYGSILERMFSLNNINTSLAVLFPEMSSSTATIMLRQAFPGKLATTQPWAAYILLTVGLKRCGECAEIKKVSEFSINVARSDTLSYTCKICQAKYRKDNKERIAECNKQYYQDNKEDIAQYHKQYYQDNKEGLAGYHKQYYQDNKEDMAEQKKHYYQENRAGYAARQIERRQLQAKATPPWANMTVMNSIYKNRPEGHHVDHIVPLKGELVCGLHCEHNLQYLPAADNIAKSNRFSSDTYIHTLPESTK